SSTSSADSSLPEPIRIFTDIYNANRILREHEKICAQPRNPADGPAVEYVNAAICLWSNMIHLTSFGSAALWPIYLYFGNLSKYIRGMPTEFAVHHLAYIPAPPADVKDCYKTEHGTTPSADVLTFCKCELMQRIWLLLLDEEFMKVYEHGILVAALREHTPPSTKLPRCDSGCGGTQSVFAPSARVRRGPHELGTLLQSERNALALVRRPVESHVCTPHGRTIIGMLTNPARSSTVGPSTGAEHTGRCAPPNLNEPSPNEHIPAGAALSRGPRPDLLSRISDPSSPKRGRDVFEDGSGDEDWIDEERHKSKRPIDETLFPFVSTEAVQFLYGDLQRTLVLKENYTRDLSLAKQRVVCSLGCPSIPDSVWVDVLANRSVDLDKIFSAIYTVDGDRKSSIKLGELELVGFPTKPKRYVERHGHWTVAWALDQRAVLYVYPHGEGELRTYSHQINSFFAAVSEHESARVINLDRAIRGEVGRSNTLLLSNFSHVNHLHAMLRENPTPIVANKSPRHFRGVLWEHNEPPATPLASLSESMSPLPLPPPSELANAAAWSTIRSFPHLFAIKTPIKADVLEALLVDHPNQPLVASVCRGFREGFWPFVDASQQASFSETWDETNAPLDDKAALFPSPYAEVEERAGRYSAPFSGELLPGMYSMMPVRKPHTEKLRFNNNHSAGRFSLNSMMDKHAVDMRPDNVQDFVHNLLHFRRAHGMIRVILFKSDIANAYRLLPMHPLWQLKQVVTVKTLTRQHAKGKRPASSAPTSSPATTTAHPSPTATASSTSTTDPQTATRTPVPLANHLRSAQLGTDITGKTNIPALRNDVATLAGHLDHVTRTHVTDRATIRDALLRLTNSVEELRTNSAAAPATTDQAFRDLEGRVHRLAQGLEREEDARCRFLDQPPLVLMMNTSMIR
ncbi:hypothetical protein VTO73DRAFT_15133, partial [Trametes versicolor]